MGTMAIMFILVLILTTWLAHITVGSAVIVAGLATVVYCFIRALFAKGA